MDIPIRKEYKKIYVWVNPYEENIRRYKIGYSCKKLADLEKFSDIPKSLQK